MPDSSPFHATAATRVPPSTPGRSATGFIAIVALLSSWAAIGAGPPSALQWAHAAVSGTSAGIVFEDRFQLGARISLDKQVIGGDPYAEVGDVVEYELVAVNSGDVALREVVVSDPELADLECTPAQPVDLAPDGQLVCTGSRGMDQADIDEAESTNFADVAGLDRDDEFVFDTAQATVTGPEPDPQLEVSKQRIDSSEPVELGTVLEFEINAVNTGNVTLIELTVTDSLVPVAQSGDCEWDWLEGELVPGDQVVCSIAYTVIQDDVDVGEVVNTGFVSGRDQNLLVISDSETVTVDVGQHPDLSVVKKLTDPIPDPIVEGSVLTFEIQAENTGDITLDNVDVDDSLGTAEDCQWDGTPDQLTPGESVVCSYDYTVNSDDVADSEVINTGSATAEDPEGAEIASSDTVTTPIESPDPPPGPTPIEIALEPLLQADNLVRAWYQDPDTKEWHFYDPREEFEDSNTLHELIDGEPYWLRIDHDQTVVLNGIERELTCTDPGTPDEDCWNLIVW